ncbi:hypothetical protein EPUS_01173 [Endocarpon pusillum Z07020]|uniref:Uncharacterized protein n=1 Tax=Endocarpon pusillum (strain Z07020 / HMAS-L-300199) TaxID=1263415 RepID=U1GC09_ENDPU|nr:uncharacterized protein EPUS_01173 [Endocarpon pusillum Z07020]ERF69216.1 hypothetical protein EPUS_01173 [Endocarpon pusillum Z07020]
MRCIDTNATHVQRQNVPPSAPAQTAAAQAFLANRQSGTNLSASAAAAALRAMSPTPTPVAETQTKRMLQRQSSTASRGDGAELQRRNSGGSMTERTFRSPSPNRPAQNPSMENAPPVPPVPKSYNDNHNHRRAASVEPWMRVASPLPTKKGSRVASLDRAPVFAQKKLKSQHQTSATDENELEKSGSRASVNFSYPTGARPNSPPVGQHLSQSQNQAINGILQQAVDDIQNTLRQTADEPVRKRKKRVTNGTTEGSHLASGGMGGKASGAAVATSSTIAPNPGKTSTPPAKRKKKANSSTTPEIDSRRETPAYGSDSDSTPDTSKGRRAIRASGLLNKQPSVVREDWEGERGDSSQLGLREEQGSNAGPSSISSPSKVRGRKETAIADKSSTIMDTSDNTIREARPTPHLITTLPTPTTKPRAETPSNGHLEVSKDSDRPTRQTSISPSRSTRFSTHLASEFSGRPTHEPPPRSVSPAKSALKHHSPSPQSSSPIDGARTSGWKRTSQASSEASDNASMTSADGFGSKPQRKKSARVSFEAAPDVVGTAADVTPSDTPVFVSPQHKDSSKKGWFGRSKGGHLDAIPAEDDMEEVMKPRPVLPSFGSVRGRRDGSAEGTVPVAEVVSPSSSESSSSSNLATIETSISSDHAIGAIFAREALKTGHDAKSNSTSSNHGPTTRKTSESIDQAGKSVTNGTVHASSDEKSGLFLTPSIPSIAIQPATPGIGETEAQDEWIVEVPGGFPEAFELEGDAPTTRQRDAVATEDRKITTSSPAEAGISEPKPPQLVAAADPSVPTVGSISESFRHQIEPESDTESGGSSIYSDAAEDLSDLEGDGFGSINAIVESPVVGLPADHMATPPDSPLAGIAGSGPTAASTRHGSWERAEAHWRKVAERQRNIDEDEQREQYTVQPKPRKRKNPRKTGQAVAATQPLNSSSLDPDSPQRNQPQTSAFPATSQGRAVSGQGEMRRSMRGQPGDTSSAPGLKTSMRTNRPPEPQARSVPPTSLPKGALQKKRIPASPATSSPVAGKDTKSSPAISPSSLTPLRRTLSNGSDSSSSFKRSRRRPASSTNRSTMRTSMRSGADRPVSPPALAGRGVRSLSPQDRRPFSPMGQGTMRTSMRGSGDAGVPSLRKQDQQRPSSTISGFGKPRSKVKATPSKALTSKLKSRFADSDEDVSEPQTFRSRFEDSSDEEAGVTKYRPVRGIPTRPDEGDSTDLEDSSDEAEKRRAKSRRQGPKSPDAVNGARTSIAKEPDISSPVESLAPPVNGKKKGIFGRFGGKKSKDVTTDAQPTKAERDMHSPRLRADLDGGRSPEMPASPEGRGKLQRRHTPQRLTSDSWPLPLKATADDDDRPQTSNGTGTAQDANGRPGWGTRQDTSGTVRTEDGTPVLGRTGKKKRFPKLRKAFGLHD